MIKVPKEYIIEKIREKSGLSIEKINEKISEKLEQLSGLISEDGAAHIIANELGIKIMDAPENIIIKNVFSGMRNVEITGKVVRIYEVRTFNTPQRSGKVGSFMVGDSSGQIRIVAWGNQADVLSKLKEEDVVRIKSGYAKENLGKIELHLNDNSQIIINPEGVIVNDVKANEGNIRKKIVELNSDDKNVELIGTIVQAFDPRYFEVCPKCFKRIKMQSEGFRCEAHGVISSPDYSYVMNAVLDDGSETIRSIFFKNQMQHLVNLTHEEIINNKGGSFENIKNDLLGKIIKVVGRVSTNEMFSRIEFVTQTVDPNPNPDEELKKIESNNKITNPVTPVIMNKEVKVNQSKPLAQIVKKEEKEDIMQLEDIEKLDEDDIYE